MTLPAPGSGSACLLPQSCNLMTEHLLVPSNLSFLPTSSSTYRDEPNNKSVISSVSMQVQELALSLSDPGHGTYML